jgi:hypothetical protein
MYARASSEVAGVSGSEIRVLVADMGMFGLKNRVKTR